MSCKSTTLEYQAGDTTCIGEYFTPKDATGPLPVVVVVHAWDGLNEEVRDKCHRLAHEGYIAFAADIHGNGKTYSDPSELEAALGPFFQDRAMLLERTRGAVDAAKTIPGADATRIGAMGYCFGGTAVLDVARAGGLGVSGVVSFHGGLEGNTLDKPAATDCKVLVLHGQDDPMVPPDKVAAFMAEMDAQKADWQLHAYSGTMHAFTRPAANNPDFGTVYNAAAYRRSWQAMCNFFDEIL
ncbi:MAG: dienelactone hydrolase family protein [Halioglobus sp.]|nr:dienelactone hydrolase family protein [Halioglobus sp.]